MREWYGVLTLQSAMSTGIGADLSGHLKCMPGTIGVSTECAFCWPYLLTSWLILTVYDSDMVWFSWLHNIAMPRVSFGSPNSVISHLVLSKLWNCSVSFRDDLATIMSLMCMANIRVPVGELRWYTHHSQLIHSKPHCMMALWNIRFHIWPACFIPYMLFIRHMTHSSLPRDAKPGGCSINMVSSSGKMLCRKAVLMSNCFRS